METSENLRRKTDSNQNMKSPDQKTRKRYITIEARVLVTQNGNLVYPYFFDKREVVFLRHVNCETAFLLAVKRDRQLTQ